MQTRIVLGWLSLGVVLLGGCGSDGGDGDTDSGGQAGLAFGSGGEVSSGGDLATAGSGGDGAAGEPTAGGTPGAGGSAGDGAAGEPASGGTPGTGGSAGDGAAGEAASGGTPSTGGSAGQSTGGDPGVSGSAGAGAVAGGGDGGMPSSGGSAGDAGGPGTAGGATGSGGSAGGSTTACGAIATFEDGLSPSNEVFVSPTGSDSNDGTRDLPFATLERAAQEATPGTALRLLPGQHAGGSYLSELAGTAAAPIWIGGVPGEARPVLSGGANGVQLSRVRYVVVHDLEVADATGNGINCDDGGDYANPDATRFVVFRDLDVHDIGGDGNQDCLKLSGLDDFWVLDSTFARCGGGMSGSGVDHVGCHAGLIARNTFTTMSGNAVQCKGASEDIEIRNNHFVDAGQRGVNLGGSTDYEFFRPPLSTSEPNAEARDIRVLGNLFEGGVAAVAFVGCVDCLAANNTILNPTNWILRILQERVTDANYTFLPAQGGRFSNNLVYYDRSALSTTVNVGPDTDAPSFTFENNLWYAHDAPASSAPTDLPTPESGAIVGTDPGLGDPADGAISIEASSPAGGAGVDLADLTTDLAGDCYASPPSIGADEVD